MNAYFNAFGRIFDYSGRSTRSEFWLFQLFWSLVAVVTYLLVAALWPSLVSEEGIDLPTIALWAVHIPPALSLLARRLHDTGRPIYWIALLFVLPVVGLLVVFGLACQFSQEGENEYGPDPHEWDVGGERFTRTARQEPITAPAVPPLPVEQLEKLQGLRTSGAIDDVEFTFAPVGRAEQMRTVLPRLAAAVAVTMFAGPALAQYDSEVNVGGLLLYIGFVIALVIGAIWVLLIPSIIAFRRRHPHRWLILVINVLFSATGIGWIIALIWALNSLPFTDDFHGRLGTVRVAADRPLPVALAPSRPHDTPDAADQLRRLKQLHADGALTDEEYQRARKPLLDRLLN